MLAVVVVACSAEDRPGPEWTPNTSDDTTSSNASTTSSQSSGQGGQGGESMGQGGGLAAPCTDLCLNGVPGGEACEGCITNQCADPLASCVADPGIADVCLGCGDVLNGGDPALLCPESQLILEKLRLCICGDGNVAGACN